MEEERMLSSDMCELRLESQIAILTLHNGRYNKLKTPDFIELGPFKEWMDRNHPKGLIITGAGRNFSAGADLEAMKEYGGDYEAISQALTKGKEILTYIEQLHMITVAAISGCCYGGGLEIALSCKYRIASKGAFFAFPESKLGLLPGLGGTKRLKQVVGKQKAISMILTGELYSAEDAFAMQLVDEVVEKGNHIEAGARYINQLCEGDGDLKHISDVIAAIESDSEQLETELFLKYLAKKDQHEE